MQAAVQEIAIQKIRSVTVKKSGQPEVMMKSINRSNAHRIIPA